MAGAIAYRSWLSHIRRAFHLDGRRVHVFQATSGRFRSSGGTPRIGCPFERGYDVLLMHRRPGVAQHTKQNKFRARKRRFGIFVILKHLVHATGDDTAFLGVLDICEEKIESRFRVVQPLVKRFAALFVSPLFIPVIRHGDTLQS